MPYKSCAKVQGKGLACTCARNTSPNCRKCPICASRIPVLCARMNPIVTTLLEVVKYLLPALVVLAASYLIVQKFLVSELQRKQIALLQETQNVTLPLRLQAYERLTIFIERISNRALVARISEPGMTVADLRYSLVMAIAGEWDHNLSQQIYVSRGVWETVKSVKEQETALIHQLATQLSAEAPAKDLQIRLADYLMTLDGDPPVEIALAMIAEEAKRVLSFGPNA